MTGGLLGWGFLPSRDEYLAVLASADVVVSTAQHEFFGIAMVEAVAAGCFPLAPKRLAYPEVLSDCADYFHDGTPQGLADRLAKFAQQLEGSNAIGTGAQLTLTMRDRFAWPRRASAMDDALGRVIAAIQANRGNQ